jgi:subtilisin family serine protease
MFVPLDNGPVVDVSLKTTQIVDFGVHAIHSEVAWKETQGDGIKVAVLDTGSSPAHPDLALNVVYCSGNDTPQQAHGTHVSGIIAACNNSYGVVGVAPASKLYCYQVLPGGGDAIAQAIDAAVLQGCDIIHMSLGAYGDYPPLHDAIKRAYADGVVIVAAAGNDPNQVAYPAAYQEVIAVSALDQNMQKAVFAPLVPNHIAMPGVNILSTWAPDQYARMSGTSQAAPLLSGTIALMLAKFRPKRSDVHDLVQQELTKIDKQSDSFFYTPDLALL